MYHIFEKGTKFFVAEIIEIDRLGAYMGPVKAMVMGGENAIFSSPKLAHIRKANIEPPLNFDAFIQ